MPTRQPAGQAPAQCTDFASLERELRAFVVAHGRHGILPGKAELLAAGPRVREGPDLVGAIALHGRPCVRGNAQALSLLAESRQPRARAAGLRRDARTERRATPSRTRGQAELLAAGRADLVNAIKRAGGGEAVAERPAFAVEQGRQGVMWTTKELARAGRADFKYAIERYGGFAKVNSGWGWLPRYELPP